MWIPGRRRLKGSYGAQENATDAPPPLAEVGEALSVSPVFA
jgi:hypothetical protein